MGLIPGSAVLEGDWDVDGPDVVKRPRKTKTVLQFMADAHRQPIMVGNMDGASQQEE